jgi:hypothetical protein
MSADDYGFIDVALVVSIKALRGILRTLHVDGKNWWIGVDPERARETGWISLGWGDQGCSNPLNVQYFRAPLVDLDQESPPDKLLVLFDASLFISEDRGICSSIGDWENFFAPLQMALIAKLQGETPQRKR